MTPRRRAAAVVAPLAATALGLGLGTGPAGAASRSRSDSFTFTNRAGASVTCTVESSQDLDSGNGFLTLSTTISGPADCTPSSIGVYVEYHLRPDGDSASASVSGDGRSISAFFREAAPSVFSTHSVSVAACDCTPSYDLHQSK
jgi:hypothetical protein